MRRGRSAQHDSLGGLSLRIGTLSRAYWSPARIYNPQCLAASSAQASMRWGCTAHRICEPAIQAVLARRTLSRLNSNDESGTDQDTPSPGRPRRLCRPVVGAARLSRGVGANYQPGTRAHDEQETARSTATQRWGPTS